MRRRATTGAVLALTVLVVGLVVAQVDLDALRRTSSAADPWVVVAGGAASLFIAVALSAEGLRWTLRGFSHEVSARTALQATVGNLAMNGVLPAGTGQLSRGAWLHRAAGTPAGVALASAVATLWFKLLALLAASSLALAVLPGASAAARAGVIGATVAVLVGGVVSLPLAPRAAPWLPRRVRPLAVELGGARVRLGPLAVGGLYAAATVAAEWVLFAALLVGVGGPWLPVETVAWFPLATIAGKLPVTAMGFGTREATVLWLFEGATPEQLLTASLWFSTLGQLLPAVVGTAWTWSFLRGLAAAREA